MIIILLVRTSTNSVIEGEVLERKGIEKKTKRGKANTLLSQIYITGSNWSEAKLQGLCTGEGTENNPYLIANHEIDATNSSTGSGILIENSAASFVIQNCHVYNANTSWADAGIKIVDASNGVILNNTCSFNNRFGICVQNGENILITRNSIYNNSQNGIFVERTDGIIIFQNDIYKNDANKTYDIGARGTGVNILSCNFGIVIENNIQRNYRGVHFAQTNYSYILNNTIHNHLYIGILSDHSHDNTILENNLAQNEGTGIITSGAGYNITDNQLRELGERGILVSDGNGSVVVGNTIEDTQEEGILAMNCTYAEIRENNVITSETKGVSLTGCTNSTITNNQITSCKETGMFLYNSTENEISQNVIKRNGGYGIHLSSSDNNTITENKLMFNNEGCINEENCQGNNFQGNICSDLVVRYSIIGGVGLVLLIGVPITIILLKKRATKGSK
ncbi:MAG: NosD domain-containing protein [Asgard group archaeon]|nr:NosD domain-containing protein [Asgard group archaeon]